MALKITVQAKPTCSDSYLASLFTVYESRIYTNDGNVEISRKSSKSVKSNIPGINNDIQEPGRFILDN